MDKKLIEAANYWLNEKYVDRDLVNIVVTVDDVEYSVDARYYPAERGSRERGGLQLEPDYPAYYEIDSIKYAETGEYVDKDDEDADIKEIEKKAYDEFEEMIDDSRYGRDRDDYDRYEDY